jgi:uncharacterized protein
MRRNNRPNFLLGIGLDEDVWFFGDFSLASHVNSIKNDAPTSNHGVDRSQIYGFAKPRAVLLEAATFMTKSQPKVWILASPHSGDNTQLLALAEALNWPFDIKSLTYHPWQGLTRVMPTATLFGLTQKARLTLSAPFPDLIIGAGHSTEPAAFWIKSQASHPVKLVYVGTPLANLEKFDLVITTPQYRLPQRANVLHIDLPMHSIADSKLKTAAAQWHPRLAHLPKPWTAVLVGGASGPYTFTEHAATRLVRLSENIPGSLLVSSSARTPPSVTKAFRAGLIDPHYFHDWKDKSAENPLFGFLALADRFIVTADSISMLSEACATGKPVMMFDTETGNFAMRDDNRRIKIWGRSLYATLFRMAMRIGPRNWTRDLRIVHQQLVAAGLANWIGEPESATQTKPKVSSLQQATSRVLALFEI